MAFNRILTALRKRRAPAPITRIRRRIRALSEALARGDTRRAQRISERLQKSGIFISSKARLSPCVRFPHPTNIVIGEGCVVEKGVTLYQSVTLGGARVGDWQAGRYPTIGADTTIFAGAVVAGAVRVGRGCTIGANAVVLDDVPDGATAVGAPARIVTPRTAAQTMPPPMPAPVVPLRRGARG